MPGPGDVVLLEPGDRVPADGRLVVAESMEVDESTLTGESVPVVKNTAAVPAGAGAKAPLAERTCMAYMNTDLTRGQAEMVVTATGMRTEVGAIAEMLQRGQEPQTPLQVQLDAVGKRIALIGGIAVAAYAELALARGEFFGDILLTAVALAVATVPEGLPAVLALTLALGVTRMARRGAIVKRVASVETLGSATVICSDKTGTLTLNQMTARELLYAGRPIRIDDEGYTPNGTHVDDSTGATAHDLAGLLEPLALCSDAELTDPTVVAPSGPGIVGDPTEGALVVAASKAGIDVKALRSARPRIAELPFETPASSWPPCTTTTATPWPISKGAPDVLLARCEHVLTAQGVRPLDAAEHARVTADVSELASQGLRILAAATTLLCDPPTAGLHNRPPADHLAERLTGLTWLGLVGIADPPRPQAGDAIKLAHRAGVTVKMITGDHRDTAAPIARELRLVPCAVRVIAANAASALACWPRLPVVSRRPRFERAPCDARGGRRRIWS